MVLDAFGRSLPALPLARTLLPSFASSERWQTPAAVKCLAPKRLRKRVRKMRDSERQVEDKQAKELRFELQYREVPDF